MSEQNLLFVLSKQKADFVDFVDSISIKKYPNKYNANYDCLAFVKISNAPNVLDQYYYVYRTKQMKRIDYISFDDYYKIHGNFESSINIVVNYNRERASFCLLSFEDEGILINSPFLVVENILNSHPCAELDYSSIKFTGHVLKQNQIELVASYKYNATCKEAEEVVIQKTLIINL